MKKTMRKFSAIVLTVALLAALAISPANLGVLAEETTPAYQEPYVIATNIGSIAWDIPEGKNLIKNASLEYGDTTDDGCDELGTFKDSEGFYRWTESTGTVMRTADVGGVKYPITDYFYLTNEDKHTGNRSLKSAHSTVDWSSFKLSVNVNDDRYDRLHNDTNYVLTFWAKTDVATPQYSHYEMLYDPKNDQTTHAGDQPSGIYNWHMYASKEDTTDGTNDRHSGKYSNADKNVWKQYTIIFNTGNNANFIKLNLVGLEGNVYYDDFALYELDRPIIREKDYGFYHYSSSTVNAIEKTTGNAGIENGATSNAKGWVEKLDSTHDSYSQYSQYYSIVTDEKHSGDASLRYYSPSGNGALMTINAWGLSYYTDYVLSFWAKGSSNGSEIIKLGFWSDDLNTTAAFRDYSGENEGLANFALDSEDWKQYTFIFNSANVKNVQIILTGAKAENPIYFDDFSIIPASATLTYVKENNDTIETVTSTSQATNFEYSTFDDAGDDATKWSGFLHNLNTNITTNTAMANKQFYSISDEEAHSGTKSFKYTRGDVDAENGTGFYITSNPLEKETEYILSFWVKGHRGTADNNWKIFTNDVGGNCIRDFSNGTDTGAQYRLVTADGWHQYSYRIKTGNSADDITVSLILMGQKNTTLYFDDISIVKADTVTYTKPTTPVKAKMSSGRIEIEKQNNVLYYAVIKADEEYTDNMWKTSNVFDWLLPNTEYKIAVKTKANTEIVEGINLTTYKKGDADYSGAVSIADMVRCYKVVTKAANDTDFNADTDNSGVLDSADVIAIRDILLK